MGWAFWLLAPLTVTVLTAVLTWWSGRPRTRPSAVQAIAEHHRFLAVLADAPTPLRGPGSKVA